MDEQTIETKIMKSWRLHPEIAKAIENGWTDHEYPNETAYVEAIFRRVFGIPDPPTPKPPRIAKQALESMA